MPLGRRTEDDEARKPLPLGAEAGGGDATPLATLLGWNWAVLDRVAPGLREEVFRPAPPPPPTTASDDDDHGADGDDHGPHPLDTPGEALAPQLSGPPEPAVIASGVVLTDTPSGGVGVTYGDTFKLHSLPGSGFKVFLDFDGFTTAGTAWNTYWKNSSFYSPAFSTDSSESFTAAELLAIQKVWQRVAEYFAPFDIDVTTEDPGTAGLSYSGTGDRNFGIRVVITDEAGKTGGGIGYVGSFDWSSDTPVYVYANALQDNAKYIADAAAHEAGHSLGLSHDGRVVAGTTTEYYSGHGSGTTGWAPVMGVGYYANVVQWSNGAYLNANQRQDDLTIITTQNSGVTWRTDEVGGTFSAAAPLRATVANGIATVKTFGVIAGSGANNDVDMYSLSVAAGGSVDLTVSAFTQVFVAGAAAPRYVASPFSMLDAQVSLYDGSFTRIALSDDATRIDGRITVSNLAGGTYYLGIDGTGWGSPNAATPTGWTEYGSLGQYMVSGTYSASGAAPARLVVSKTALATTEAGGSDSFMVQVTGATSDVAIGISGVDATEARLSAGSFVLNAANNWTQTVTVTGLDDRDADGTQAFALRVSAGAIGSATVNVTNADNDIAAATAGGAAGTYSRLPTSSNGLRGLAADDGVAQILTEGLTGGTAGLDWRWKFLNLSAGDKIVHVDAASASEAFRLEYSTNGGTVWNAFAGAPAASTRWAGDFVATGVGTSLFVRLVDTMRSGDTVRDSILVDLLTIEDMSATKSIAAAALRADWL